MPFFAALGSVTGISRAGFRTYAVYHTRGVTFFCLPCFMFCMSCLVWFEYGVRASLGPVSCGTSDFRKGNMRVCVRV